MVKNKIIKGSIPYSELNRTLNVEPDEEITAAFEELLTLVDNLSEEEKREILKPK